MSRALLHNNDVKVLNLPSTWTTSIPDQYKSVIEAVNISPDNPEYCSIDGVVYNKDVTELLLYPRCKRDLIYTTPSSVTTVGNAFHVFEYLQTLNISDSVTSLKSSYSSIDCFIAGLTLKTVNLGKGIQDINGDIFWDSSNEFFSGKVHSDGTPYYPLTQVNVDPQNPYFTSVDGVLYSKDMSEIVFYPYAKPVESFTAPTTVTRVGNKAFFSCVYLKEIVFPTKIQYLGEDAIGGHFYPDGAGALDHNCLLDYIVFLDGVSNPSYAGKVDWAAYSCFGEINTILVGDDSVKQLIEYGDEAKLMSGAFDYMTIADYKLAKAQPKQGKWMQDSTGWWYKNADGSYPKNAWTQIGGAWYHFNKSGYMQTGWQQIGGTWYYLNPSGAMATGWTKVGGTWYYLKSSGAMATGWQKVGGSWYYLNGSGAMQTGWYKVGPKWYYSNASGAMQANRWIGNYYVGSSGAMATSQWVGNYYVDASGLWVK